MSYHIAPQLVGLSEEALNQSLRAYGYNQPADLEKEPGTPCYFKRAHVAFTHCRFGNLCDCGQLFRSTFYVRRNYRRVGHLFLPGQAK
jgi:hypothetical protein